MFLEFYDISLLFNIVVKVQETIQSLVNHELHYKECMLQAVADSTEVYIYNQ